MAPTRMEMHLIGPRELFGDLLGAGGGGAAVHVRPTAFSREEDSVDAPHSRRELELPHSWTVVHTSLFRRTANPGARLFLFPSSTRSWRTPRCEGDGARGSFAHIRATVPSVGTPQETQEPLGLLPHSNSYTITPGPHVLLVPGGTTSPDIAAPFAGRGASRSSCHKILGGHRAASRDNQGPSQYSTNRPWTAGGKRSSGCRP